MLFLISDRNTRTTEYGWKSRAITVKNKILFLLFWLPFAANVFAQSPAHGAWWSHGTYTNWNNDGRPVYDPDKGEVYELPRVNRIDGIAYLSYAYTYLTITNEEFRPGDGIFWNIVSYEKDDGKVIYRLASRMSEAKGTITVAFIDENTMSLDTFDGDDNFVAEVKYSSLPRFGELLHRVPAEE